MFRNKLIWLIVLSSLLRLLVAGTTELGNDEVYYYTYALHLQWNYFDHPPGVALLIQLSTLHLWLTGEVFIRLGAIVCAAAGTWLSYKIGQATRNERTGWYAAVLYTANIYTSVIAGTFILPDSPQVVCWLAALYVLIKMVLQLNSGNRISARYWLLFGLLSGLCIQCKVHGVFLWFGFGLYLLLYSRKTLLQPLLYVSFVITAIIISPIILWNVNNHFITLTYHSSRLTGYHININSFLQAISGQIFYNNPVVVFIIAQAIRISASKRFLQPCLQRLFLLTGLPIIILVSLISLFNSVLPHWSGPGFLTLSFIGAAYLDRTINFNKKTLSPALKSALLLIATTVFAGMAVIHFYPGTFGSTKIENYGSGDFTLDLSGWKDFAQSYKQWMYEQSNNNEYRRLPIVCNKWFPAAHIDYYIARTNHTQMVGVGNLQDLHNFVWLNKARTDLKPGEDALCIVPSNYTVDVTNVYGNTFSSVIRLHTFVAKRSGKTTRFFTLFLLKNYKPVDEAHTVTVN